MYLAERHLYYFGRHNVCGIVDMFRRIQRHLHQYSCYTTTIVPNTEVSCECLYVRKPIKIMYALKVLFWEKFATNSSAYYK